MSRISSPSPVRALVALAACLLGGLSACTIEQIGGAGPQFEAFGFSFADPHSDTLPHVTTTSRRALDLVGVSGSVEATALAVTLTFSTPIAPWSHQATGSIDGFIDFDLDENSATGIPGAAEEYGGSAPLGADYYISLRDAEPGHVALLLPGTSQYWAVPAFWSGSEMRIRVPRTLLGDPDGHFRLSVVVGHPELSATDFAPSEGYYTVHR